MTKTITLAEAQAKLPELIENLAPDDEVVITRDDQPVARIMLPTTTEPRPVFGNCAGMLTIVVEDEEHLKDFRDYMP